MMEHPDVSLGHHYCWVLTMFVLAEVAKVAAFYNGGGFSQPWNTSINVMFLNPVSGRSVAIVIY